MCKRFLLLPLSAILIASLLCAQDEKPAKPSNGKASEGSAPASKKTVPKSTAHSKQTAKGKGAQSAKNKRVNPARVRRMSRAFVASTTLKPMARQLIEARTSSAYAGVENYARQHADSDAGAMAWLAIGYAHILDKEYSKAIPALQKAKPRAGELADYVRYFEGLAYGGTAQSEKVVAALKDFEKESADSIFLHDVTAIYGSALTASGKAAAAIDYLEAHRKPTRADVEVALGHAYMAGGNTVKGTEILRRVYFTMPVSPETTQAGAELVARGYNLSAYYVEVKAHAGLLTRANQWQDAVREYQQALAMAPPEERGEVQVALAIALRRAGHEREGRDLLRSTQASGEPNAQRLYSLVEIARVEDNEADLLNYLAQMRQSTPASPWFQQALISAGNMYLLRRDYDHAIDSYREAQAHLTDGPRSAYAHWKAAWLTYRQGRLEEAKKEFTRHVEVYSTSPEAAAAVYWRARLAEQQNDLTTARAWYAKAADRFRNYYYGYLARERLAKIGDSPAIHDPVLDRIPPVPPRTLAAAQITAPATELRVEKSKLLENAGMTDFAIKELKAVDGGKDANWATLEIARIYGEGGQYHRALRFMKSAVPSYFAIDISALPRQYWDYLFPRPYWTDVRRFSLLNQLDPYLVAALIRQESEFNPGAVSRSNALGLMQLLPVTGRKVAKELHLRGYRTANLLVPNTNLQLGTRYLNAMVQLHGGQIEYALAAYNAGDHRVADWLSGANYRDIAEFVESIPFTETREYVQSIMRNAQIYRKLYPQ
jgi:soluble lytic murein transglycosylase